MPRILLIEDDDCVRKAIGRILTLHGYEFVGTGTGQDGLRLAREWDPAVAVVDHGLPDMSGIDVLAQLGASCPRTARIILTGRTGDSTLELAIQAMRLGSCDCLVKPVLSEDLLAAVARIVRRPVEGNLILPWPGSEIVSSEAHAAVRWAEPVKRAIDSPRDPRTLSEFAKAVAVSVGTFRNWCRTARVQSRASLDFARALRAVAIFERDQSTRPENLLSIVDRRTIAKFVRKSGGHSDQLPDSIPAFLEHQQFIANREAVEAVRAALANRSVRLARNGPPPHGALSRRVDVSLPAGGRDTANDR